jgi:hypothetical protein
MRSYIVISSQAYCSPNGPSGISYHWDGDRFEQRQHAVEHGFAAQGSDDFNIGVVDGDELVDLLWMEESIEESKTQLRIIQKEIAL